MKRGKVGLSNEKGRREESMVTATDEAKRGNGNQLYNQVCGYADSPHKSAPLG